MKHFFPLLIFAITLSVSALAYTNTQQIVAAPPELVSFPTQDGGLIYANLYGKGERGVVLAHGGRFNKESWEKQAQVLVRAGFHVLALDFRGYGQSKGPGDKEPMGAPLHLDVLAAVRYLHKAGTKTVAVVGGSMGGGAGVDATIEAAPGEIARLVTLGGLTWNSPVEKLKCPLLVIVTRNDTSGDGPRLPKILADYKRVPKPKKLIILEGSAHAQFMFETKDSERVMREILRFLSAR